MDGVFYRTQLANDRWRDRVFPIANMRFVLVIVIWVGYIITLKTNFDFGFKLWLYL